MLKDYPDILTISQVCEILDISKNTLYSLIRSNAIPAFRIGEKIWRIKKENVISYCQNSK